VPHLNRVHGIDLYSGCDPTFLVVCGWHHLIYRASAALAILFIAVALASDAYPRGHNGEELAFRFLRPCSPPQRGLVRVQACGW
jgi:hypothetical protein